MRLGGDAKFLAEVHSRDEVAEAVSWAEERKLPVLMIGGGSNIIWRDEGFPGLIMVNKIPGFEEKTDGDDVLVTIGGGEDWDDVVARTVDEGLTGVEPLSLIPGTAGATPVQNVGAYGREIAEVLENAEVYDAQTKQFTTIAAADCNFGYRTSRFKTTDRGRFFITAITLRLRRGNPGPPFYAALQTYFDEHNITEFTPRVVRDAVIAIRSSKLPDPAQVANNGSFFANPIITEEKFQKLQAEYPDIPSWPTDDGRHKIPAGWLMDQAGFRGVHDEETGMGTWPQQALVLVNEHAQSTTDLLKFRAKIISAVQTKFGITLQQEPELL
jgi:UDP-N-acetylmuramate dehydrogenase